MVSVSDRTAASRAKTALAADLSAEPGVVGIGLARRDSGYILKVDVADMAVARRMPGAVDGVPVETEIIGAVRPL
jgi:hypothetical protein